MIKLEDLEIKHQSDKVAEKIYDYYYYSHAEIVECSEEEIETYGVTKKRKGIRELFDIATKYLYNEDVKIYVLRPRRFYSQHHLFRSKEDAENYALELINKQSTTK
jgi:hypothetical protein